MANIHPEDRANMPPEVEQLITLCSALPNNWNIYVGWPELGQETPDLLVVSPSQKAAVLSASAATPSILDTWSPEHRTNTSDILPIRRLNRAIWALANTPVPSMPRWLVLTRARPEQISALFIANLPNAVICCS